MNINKLRNKTYLDQHDCDPPIVATMKTLRQENMSEDIQNPDLKWVLYFEEDIKPTVLNWTNIQLVAQAVGADDTDEWPGKKIELYREPNVSFGGKLVGGIRVRAVKDKGRKVKQAA